jgi:F-type H+-transporting ATPase subunit alpha
VSRVGGAAQTKAIKAAGGGLKLSLAQFRELAAFSQFSTDLDPETRQTIERGQRLTELLKQPQYSPYAIWEMYVLLYAANEGALDNVPIEKIKQAEEAILREVKAKHAKLVEVLNTGDKPSDKDNETVLKLAQQVAKTYEAKEAAK